MGSAATMAFVEATLKEDDAAAPPPPSDTTDNTASSRKSVTWRLPETEAAKRLVDAAAKKAARARSVPRTRIAPPPSIDVDFGDDALRRFVEQNGLSAYAHRPSSAWPIGHGCLVEATDEDVDRLSGGDGHAEAEAAEVQTGAHGLRGDSA